MSSSHSLQSFCISWMKKRGGVGWLKIFKLVPICKNHVWFGCVDSFHRKKVCIPRGILPHIQGGQSQTVSFCQGVGVGSGLFQNMFWVIEASCSQFYPNTTTAVIWYQWSTKLGRVWIWSYRGPYMTTTLPSGPSNTLICYLLNNITNKETNSENSLIKYTRLSNVCVVF